MKPIIVGTASGLGGGATYKHIFWMFGSDFPKMNSESQYRPIDCWPTLSRAPKPDLERKHRHACEHTCRQFGIRSQRRTIDEGPPVVMQREWRQ